MLARYVAWRRDPQGGGDGRTILVLPDGRPAIELELTLNMHPGWMDRAPDGSPIDPPPLQIRVILDQAWLLPDGSIEIVDLKTGSSTPVDTIQLGTQEHALIAELETQHLTYPATPNAKGLRSRYFDARKGWPTPAFSAMERHPIEELDLRYADAADRRTRATPPRPSSLCVACPVRYACPAGNRR
jgi:RecB family exonuclease